MKTDDIIKVRSALSDLLEIAIHGPESPERSSFKVRVRESLAAFERLIAAPMPAQPQIPLRAQIATAAMQGMLASPEMHEYPDDKLANYAVNAADALIERLSQEKK